MTVGMCLCVLLAASGLVYYWMNVYYIVMCTCRYFRGIDLLCHVKLYCYIHHLQLRCPSLLFCNFKQFNIKAAMDYDPVVQKDLDELLAKGSIQSSSGGASFCPKVCLVPLLNVGLQPHSVISNSITTCSFLH